MTRLKRARRVHHRLFDRGMLGLDDGFAVVFQRFSACTPQGWALYDLHGRRLRPCPSTPLPVERHAAWQREQVFQGTVLAS